MGQRHQYIVIYPGMTLGKDNPNNKPQRADLIHHQWLYGASAIKALDRVLALVGNNGPRDYHFGRSENGYAHDGGTDAIAAAISVDPSEGYYHSVNVYERNVALDEVNPTLFDNNDGITVIEFVSGKKTPNYCFITPINLEGNYWIEAHGKGPWSAEEYLRFYYGKKEQQEWDDLTKSRLELSFDNIRVNADLLTGQRVRKLLPNMGI